MYFLQFYADVTKKSKTVKAIEKFLIYSYRKWYGL